jgi:hypothetical protein
MAEQTFWIIATIIIIIIIAVALLTLFGGQMNPFRAWLGKGTIQSKLCQQLATKGCTNTYLPQLENEKSNIFYDEIGQSLRDRNNREADVNRATFGEVCEYLGFGNFDECLKNCNCLTS